MLFLKISVSVPLKFLPSGPLQKNGILVEFLKTRLLKLCACKNHTGNVDLYNTSDVQKYLKFFESGCSKLNTTSSKKVKDTLKLLGTKKDVETELKCLEEMSSQGNKELEDLIEKDKNMLLQRIKDLKGQILSSLIPFDEDNSRNVELQVVPNIGGEEAKLFSQELFEMYLKYVNYKNWEYVRDPDNGCLFISGDNIYGQLRHEMGIHRVQRVPETESMGRTHTSTCTVLVLPQPKPGEIVFNEKEVIIETMKSSGPGGQNVNKTESCVRLIHKPTGIVAESQTSRFQYENKKLAFEKLRNIIFNKKRSEMENKIIKLKKQHVATNIYSDKIRTYNYNQNRVTDHRVQYTIHNVRGLLSGSKELDRMINTVREHFVQQELIFHIQDVLESKEYKMFENQN